MKSFKKTAIACCVLPLIYACQPNIDREQAIKTAESAIEQGRYNEAEIQLKSLLSQDSNDAIARRMLGGVLLEQGNFSGAVKELERALALGDSSSELRLVLLQAQLRAGQYDDVLAFNPRALNLSPASLSEAYVLKGIAALQSEQVEDAREFLNLAIDTASDSQFAFLGQAYIASTDDDWNSALEAIEQSIAVNPDFAEAYLMQGQVLTQLEKLDLAQAAYQRYFELKPQSQEAKLIYVNSLIQNNSFDAAKPLIAELAKSFPGNPVVSQLKGVLAYVEQDFEAAKRHTDNAIQNGLRTAVSLSINGISAYELGLYEQAYRSLKSAAPDLPSDHPAIKLLFVTQMQLGFEDEAAEQFMATDFDETDASIVSMTGLSMAGSGQRESAEQALNILKDFDELSTEDLARKGMLRLQLDDLSGIEDLKSALESEPELASAQVALFDAYLKNQDYESLIAFAEQVIAEDDASTLGYNMLASGYIGLGENEKAANAYQRVLSIDPLNPASLNYFADLKAQENDFEAAAKTLEPLIMKRPRYLFGLRKYYQFLMDAGKPDEALRAIERANEIVQNSNDHTFLLANVYFARQQFAEARNALVTIEPASNLPNNFWLLLIESHFRLDNWEDAEEAMNTWVENSPFNEVAQINRVAFLQSQSRDNEARVALSEALAALPRSNSLKLMDVQQEITGGNIAVAKSKLREVENTPLTESAYNGIEAFFDLVESRSGDNTLEKLLDFYQKHPTKFAVKGIITAYQQRRDKENLLAFLEQRIIDFPRDFYSRKMLADAMFIGQPRKAEEQYALLSKVNPNDLMVINNLAWLVYEDGRIEEADSIVRQGLAIRDDVPFLIDTAAFIEKAKGNLQGALDLFAKAYSISPDASITLHYASALQESGRVDEARALLDALPSNLPPHFEEQKRKILEKL